MFVACSEGTLFGFGNMPRKKQCCWQVLRHTRNELRPSVFTFPPGFSRSSLTCLDSSARLQTSCLKLGYKLPPQPHSISNPLGPRPYSGLWRVLLVAFFAQKPTGRPPSWGPNPKTNASASTPRHLFGRRATFAEARSRLCGWGRPSASPAAGPSPHPPPGKKPKKPKPAGHSRPGHESSVLAVLFGEYHCLVASPKIESPETCKVRNPAGRMATNFNHQTSVGRKMSTNHGKKVVPTLKIYRHI